MQILTPDWGYNPGKSTQCISHTYENSLYNEIEKLIYLKLMAQIMYCSYPNIRIEVTGYHDHHCSPGHRDTQLKQE